MYRILLVEDDEVIAGMVSRHLSNWGYEVRTAEDFHDVLKTFVEFRFRFTTGITGAARSESCQRFRSCFYPLPPTI